MRRTIAIVGANLAGGRAAETLRSDGYEGRITLIGSEPTPPYERPALSKDLLLGLKDAGSTLLRTSDEWSQADVDLRTGQTVVRLLPSERSLELASGEKLQADQVMLCTGGRPRCLPVEGAQLEGVCYLRSIEDSLRLRDRLQAGATVVVVGAGFLGSEVAACARQLGCEVVMVDLADVPLARVLGPRLGEFYLRLQRERGVDVRTGLQVQRLEGRRYVEAVVTEAGERIPADVVVVGIGIEPATELAELAGLDIADGIVVDEYCRTSLGEVYAAGDVANHPNEILGERLRLEHWQNAQAQAAAAARSMMGRREPFNMVPWFWSDQYEVNLQVAGHPRSTDTVLERGRLDELDFLAIYTRNGVVVGAAAINRGRELRATVRLIEEKAACDPHELCDESLDIRKVHRVARDGGTAV